MQPNKDAFFASDKLIPFFFCYFAGLTAIASASV